METSKISRFDLYSLMAQEVLTQNLISIIEKEKLHILFSDSAKCIEGMENNFLFSNEHKLNNAEYFYQYLNDNIKDIVSTKLKNRLIHKFYRNRYELEPLHKDVNFITLFKLLIKEIVDYQNKELEHFVINNKNNNRFKNMPQIFLSYAYLDKGLTLGLFFYFLKRESFLYVNWMWTPKISNGMHVKILIEEELKHSDQLLFLRSASSELSNKGNPSIRQWCAWEIGNFYTKKRNQKYLLNMYEIARKPNNILDSFKIMSGIKDGLIF